MVLLCSAAAKVGAQGVGVAAPDEALPKVDAPALETTSPEVDTGDDATLPEQQADESKREVDIIDCFDMCFQEKLDCIEDCNGDLSCRTMCVSEYLACRRNCKP